MRSMTVVNNDNYLKELFIDEAKVALKRNNLTITDHATGKQYVIYVLDGKLMMKEQE